MRIKFWAKNTIQCWNFRIIHEGQKNCGSNPAPDTDPALLVNPDPDTDPWFGDQKFKKKTAENFFIYLF
jgi:hypothetical protein